MPTDADALSLDEVLRRIEDYRTTILALLCFIGAVTWDDANDARLPASQASLGRRMDTSASNKVQPSSPVTPDAVIQRSTHLGYTVEARKSLPLDTTLWEKTVQRLLRYDDDLVGWWTVSDGIPRHCVVLLLEISRSADFARFLQTYIRDNSLEFTRPVSVVEFTRSPEVRQFLFVRTHWGLIEDQDVSAKLASGTKVPIEDLLASYGEKKFYDARPPTEHTMEVVWQDLFTDMKTRVRFDPALKAWPIPVSVPQITKEVQRLFGSAGSEAREGQYPTADWIREAMDAFVHLGLARKANDPDEYTVLFKRLRGDIIQRFVSHRAPPPAEANKDNAGQLVLL
jgi:hypothetical protein